MIPNPIYLAIELSGSCGQIVAQPHSPIANPLVICYLQTLVLGVNSAITSSLGASITTIQFFTVADNAPAVLQAIWASIEGDPEGNFLNANALPVTITVQGSGALEIGNFNTVADQPIFLVVSGLVDLGTSCCAWVFDPEVILRSGQG